MTQKYTDRKRYLNNTPLHDLVNAPSPELNLYESLKPSCLAKSRCHLNTF